jgi:hypothetical protein
MVVVDINMSEVRADVEDRVVAMIELLVKAIDPTVAYDDP